MSWLELFGLKKRDPVQASARRWARLLARWRRKHPGRPLHECMSGAGLALLRQLAPGKAGKMESLERLFSPEHAGEDIGEFCRALVRFEMEVDPGDPEANDEVTRAVSEELFAAGVSVYTDTP